MEPAKKVRLEAAGWKAGTAQELLDLTAEEVAYIELRLRRGGLGHPSDACRGGVTLPPKERTP
jgi:hypothetical protein